MLQFNPTNGSLTFQPYTIGPTVTIQDLKSTFQDEQLELWAENGDWVTYRLKTATSLYITFLFKNHVLRSLDVYLNDLGEAPDNHQFSDLLHSIEGRQEYAWGTLELNTDSKSGFRSLLISYRE